MNIYEIDRNIASLVDEEGEIQDIEDFEALQMARDTKIENVALWIKNLTAEAEALKTECDTLTERKKSAEAKIKRLRGYLNYALNGERFETPRVVVTWRRSTQVKISDENLVPREWCDVTEVVKPRKADIKAALKLGKEVAGCELIENKNIQIS